MLRNNKCNIPTCFNLIFGMLLWSIGIGNVIFISYVPFFFIDVSSFHSGVKQRIFYEEFTDSVCFSVKFKKKENLNHFEHETQRVTPEMKITQTRAICLRLCCMYISTNIEGISASTPFQFTTTPLTFFVLCDI